MAIASVPPLVTWARCSRFCSSVPKRFSAPDHDQRHAVGGHRDLAVRGLLQEQGRVEEGAARAAVLLVDGQPVPAQLAHLGGGLVGVVVVAVELELLALGEVAQGVDEVALLGGEARLAVAVVIRRATIADRWGAAAGGAPPPTAASRSPRLVRSRTRSGAGRSGRSGAHVPRRERLLGGEHAASEVDTPTRATRARDRDASSGTALGAPASSRPSMVLTHLSQRPAVRVRVGVLAEPQRGQHVRASRRAPPPSPSA